MPATPTARRIDADVMAILERCTPELEGVRLPAERLDPKTYKRVNAVLEAAGFKWNRKAAAHIHADAAGAEALDSLLSTGEVIKPGDFGFFETTGYALDRVIELAYLAPGQKALEPNCGTGNIVARLRGAGADVFGYELLPQNVEACHRRNLFPNGGLGCRDFLTVEPAPVFHRVVMNPPFAKQADIDHVQHAMAFLKPGGRLVAIMGAGVRFRQNLKTTMFHERIALLSPTWEDLPPESFKASGTNVNTCILTLDLH